MLDQFSTCAKVTNQLKSMGHILFGSTLCLVNRRAPLIMGARCPPLFVCRKEADSWVTSSLFALSGLEQRKPGSDVKCHFLQNKRESSRESLTPGKRNTSLKENHPSGHNAEDTRPERGKGPARRRGSFLNSRSHCFFENRKDCPYTFGLYIDSPTVDRK